jgi:hypothetical protein
LAKFNSSIKAKFSSGNNHPGSQGSIRALALSSAQLLFGQIIFRLPTTDFILSSIRSEHL